MQNSSYGFGVEIPSAEQPNYQLSITCTERSRSINYQLIIIPNLLKILDN